MNKLNINKINISLQLSFFIAIFTITAPEGCCFKSSNSSNPESLQSPLMAQTSNGNHRRCCLFSRPSQQSMNPIYSTQTFNLNEESFKRKDNTWYLPSTVMIPGSNSKTAAIQSILISPTQFDELKLLGKIDLNLLVDDIQYEAEITKTINNEYEIKFYYE